MKADEMITNSEPLNGEQVEELIGYLESINAEGYEWQWNFTESGAFVDNDDDGPELSVMYRVLGRKYYWSRKLKESGEKHDDFTDEMEQAFVLLSRWMDRKFAGVKGESHD